MCEHKIIKTFILKPYGEIEIIHSLFVFCSRSVENHEIELWKGGQVVVFPHEVFVFNVVLDVRMLVA